jgi:hypothetical protein
MGCQSEVEIGKKLTFSITTHDPDTGVLTNADAAPTWRLYEDETAVPILNGTMATLDAANTTGFYSEQVTCSAANGFEGNKSYTIYIEATVDSDTGGISYAFRARDALTTAEAAAAASTSAGRIRIHRGDTMDQDISNLGDISTRAGESVWFTVKRQKDDADTDAIIMIGEDTGLMYLNGTDVSATRAAEGSITVTDAVSGDITIWMNPTATDELVPSSKYYYDVQWTDGTEVYTVADDLARITGDVTRAVA